MSTPHRGCDQDTSSVPQLTNSGLPDVYNVGGTSNQYRMNYAGSPLHYSWLTGSRCHPDREYAENPHVMEEYLEAELARGVLLCPFQREEVSGVRFGVIPKSSQPGKCSICHTQKESVSTTASIHVAVRCCVCASMRWCSSCCRRALMAMLDIKHAYQQIGSSWGCNRRRGCSLAIRFRVGTKDLHGTSRCTI